MDRVRIEIKVTKAEAEGLRAAADANGLPVATTIRQCIRSYLYDRDFKKALKKNGKVVP